ncbi:MAG: hypothetical protein ACK5KU_02845 [Beutenbergiaceae bacterium]
MTWTVLWTTLILLTALGAVLLGRRLWMSAKALKNQVVETSSVTSELLRIADAGDSGAESPPFEPAIWASPQQRQEFRAQRYQLAQLRRVRRHNRRAAALRRWRELGLDA